MTDASGRYIVDGIAAQSRKIGNVTHTNKIFVEGSRAGSQNSDVAILDFAANSVARHDFSLSVVGQTASISGTVRASGTNAPVAGVEIKVDGVAPTNAAKSGANKGKLVTGADGTYTAVIAAKPLGSTASVSASKAGMTFVPASLSAPAHAGSAVTGIDFTGFANATIFGRVVAPAGGPMSGVEVSATPASGGEAADADTTGVTGSFSLSVPFGSYNIAASSAGNYTFTYPNGVQTVNVAPGQSVNYGDIKAADGPPPPSSNTALSSLMVNGATAAAGTDGSYSVDVGNDVTQATVVAAAADAGASVSYDPSDGDDSDGSTIDLNVGANVVTVTVTAADASEMAYTVTVNRAASSDASLSSVMVNGAAVDAGADGNYSVDVGADVTAATVVAAAADAGASVSYDPSDGDDSDGSTIDPLAVGANVVTVTVTAADASEMAYTVTVNRARTPSSDASLAKFTVDGVDVMADADANFKYTVRGDVTSVTVDAMAAHAAATAAITTADDDDTMAGVQVNLDPGANTVMATVTAEDGTEETHELTVNRPEPGIVVSMEDIVLTEGDSVTYMVSLATKPTTDVTVTIAATDENDGAIDITGTGPAYMTVSTTTRSFTPSNWNVGAGREDQGRRRRLRLRPTTRTLR